MTTKENTYRVTFLCHGDDIEEWRRQVGDGEADIYDDNLHNESDFDYDDGTHRRTA